MFSLRALSSTLIVLLACGVAVAQHEGGGGATSAANFPDSGRGGSAELVALRSGPAPRRTGPLFSVTRDKEPRGASLLKLTVRTTRSRHNIKLQLKPIARLI